MSGTSKYLLPYRSSVTVTELSFPHNPDCGCKELALEDVSSYPIGDIPYHVRGKVIWVLEPQIITYRNLQKQDIYIAGQSCYVVITLWADRCGSLNIGEGYRFEPAKIQLDPESNTCYLSTTIHTQIAPVEDIPVNIKQINITNQTNTLRITDNIIGIKEVQTCITCINCQHTIFQKDTDGEFASCNSCKTPTVQFRQSSVLTL